MGPLDDTPDDHPDNDGRPSRSAGKRVAEELQSLGEDLIALKPEVLASFDLPEPLRSAISMAQTITAHGASRRQRQYIGRLMREVDAAPIRARLLAVRGEGAVARARLHRVERWRDRLIDEGDEALSALLDEHPAADRSHLRRLVREAKQERARSSERPTAPLAQRALFRVLRDLFDAVL